MKNIKYSRLWAVMLLATFLSACYGIGETESKADTLASGDRVPSVYLVTVSGQYSGHEIEALFARYGVRGIKRIDSQIYKISLTQDPGLQRLQELAAESDVIMHIQPNNIYRKN